MKRIVIILSSIALSIPSIAQLNIASIQDGHSAGNAARHLPTYLGDRFQTVQIIIGSSFISIGSNFTTVKGATDYFTADKITKEMIGSTISKLKPQDNNINAVLDAALLNVAFNFTGKDGHKGFSLGFGINERVEINTVFNKETFLLAYNGNKQFAGQTINISPRFNGLAYTDYYVSAAYNIRPRYSDMVIKPAIRLSYLSGQASVNMPKNNSISMYTEPNGRYLDFGLNYTINTSTSNDSISLAGNSFNVNNKSFQPGAGSGFGMDLGVRISPKPGILINVGLMDIGSIRFSKNAVNMFNYSKYRYEGQDITFNQGQAINLDSLSSIAMPTYTHKAYTVKLPTKMLLAGSIGFDRNGGDGSPWYRHQISLTYLQGFDNYLSSTKAPYVAMGYTRSFNNVLNLGLNAGVGGISGTSLGVLASLRLGFFNIGLNSNNILPLLIPSSGKSADAAMMIALSF